MFPAAADHLNSCVHLERATIIPGNRKIAFNICVSEMEPCRGLLSVALMISILPH